MRTHGHRKGNITLWGLLWAKLVHKIHLMSESEWRNLGVQQSQGWVHYMIHEPETHILLFRRPLPKKPKK
uniref:Cyclin-dependent kinases regulatory subunit n=1 Tax=Nomascus leucogenys TaxID=61853 RepID=A0A2I3G2A2_NOMLE